MKDSLSDDVNKKKAILASIYVVSGYGLSQIIRLASNIILTRLLVPEFFGMMAIVQVFILGVQLFSDFGIVQGLIRSPRSNNPIFINTAWTMQIIRGFMIAIVLIAISYPVSLYYNEIILFKILLIMSLSPIIQNLESTSLIILRKNLEQGRVTFIEIIIQFIGSVVMIIFAYIFRNIWALIIGDLISSIIKTLWSHCLGKEYRNKIIFNKRAATELFSFGRWIFLSTAASYLASQVDRMILGKLFTFSFLGIYNIALMFSEIPKHLIGQLAHSVIFPLMTKYRELSRENYKLKIAKTRKYILLIITVFSAFFISFSDLIIHILYDDRYSDATWILPLLAIGIWPLVLHSTIDVNLYTIGKPQYITLGNFIKFLYIIILFPLTYKFYGLKGVILSIVFNDIPVYLSVNIGLYKEKLSLLKQDLIATISLIILVVILFYFRLILGLDLYYNVSDLL